MTPDHAWLLLVPEAAETLIPELGSWGRLTCLISEPDRAVRVIALSDGKSPLQRLPDDKKHFLTSADFHPTGYWHRAAPEIAGMAYLAMRQQQALTFEFFKSKIPEIRDPGTGQYIAITYTECPPEIAPGRVLHQFSAWTVSRSGVQPMQCDFESDHGRVTDMSSHWPVADLQNQNVLLIGAGSIGGAAAAALAGYGIGELLIMDPDRLKYHNIPRHICLSTAVGKYKVDAVAEHITRKWPDTIIQPILADAIVDADILRPLIEKASVVLCSVDGVEPRRVVSYLCKRANKPLILACVLGDGRYGEILRLRPNLETGCLDCQRRALSDAGMIDLESTLDRGYGEGTRHNPMTAVGSDLHLMGALAAKSVIATILARLGHMDQLLANDNAVVALRPEAGWAEPFDSARAMTVNWYSSAPPYSTCPACNV